METKIGKKIFSGIAIGKIQFYKKSENVIARTKISDVDEEINRYEDAKKTAIEQLNDLYEKAVVEVGEANAAIFEMQKELLEKIESLPERFFETACGSGGCAGCSGCGG